jgi:ribokinase
MGDVYVIGSINMDVVATASRHPTVGETVAGTALNYFPGGKGANQAVAAARSGARTYMVGRLGSDTFSGVLSEFLADQGIDLRHVEAAAGQPSGTALIVVAAGDNTIVVVPGANESLRPEDVAALQLGSSDVAVAQFETPVDTTVAAFARANERGAKTVLNPAPAAAIPPELLSLTDVVIVNETELATISQRHVDANKEASLQSAVDEVRAKDTQAWIVTLGAFGILISGRPGSAERVAGHDVPVQDTTGAGDCFVGVLAAEVAHGRDLAHAATTANAAAALCVQQDGAGPSMPTAEAVSDFIGVAR